MCLQKGIWIDTLHVLLKAAMEKAKYLEAIMLVLADTKFS